MSSHSTGMTSIKGLRLFLWYCAFIMRSAVSAIMIYLLALCMMASSKLISFASSYVETLALAFANSSLIFSFCASHSIICFCSNSSASSTNSGTLILSSFPISLDNFGSVEDFDSLGVFDAELLLLLDKFFDMLFSSESFNQHFMFVLKENTWLSISPNHSSSFVTVATQRVTNNVIQRIAMLLLQCSYKIFTNKNIE